MFLVGIEWKHLLERDHRVFTDVTALVLSNEEQN